MRSKWTAIRLLLPSITGRQKTAERCLWTWEGKGGSQAGGPAQAPVPQLGTLGQGGLLASAARANGVQVMPRKPLDRHPRLTCGSFTGLGTMLYSGNSYTKTLGFFAYLNPNFPEHPVFLLVNSFVGGLNLVALVTDATGAFSAVP